MGCEGEMRPAAQTIDPDSCIISRYLSTSSVHIKHLHTQSGTGPRALDVPWFHWSREKTQTVQTILESQGHFLSPLLDLQDLFCFEIYAKTQLSIIKVLKRGKDKPPAGQLM